MDFNPEQLNHITYMKRTGFAVLLIKPEAVWAQGIMDIGISPEYADWNYAER